LLSKLCLLITPFVQLQIFLLNELYYPVKKLNECINKCKFNGHFHFDFIRNRWSTLQCNVSSQMTHFWVHRWHILDWPETTRAEVTAFMRWWLHYSSCVCAYVYVCVYVCMCILHIVYTSCRPSLVKHQALFILFHLMISDCNHPIYCIIFKSFCFKFYPSLFSIILLD